MIYILLFNLVLSVFSPLSEKDLHDFHVSKCDINYSVESRTFQVSIHIFLDDLELALANEGKEDLYLCTDREVREAETFVEDYIHRNLKIDIDGTIAYLHFIGKEISEDLSAVWCYLETEALDMPESVIISNSVLMETFDDQKNIVAVTNDHIRKAHILFDHRNISESVSLQ